MTVSSSACAVRCASGFSCMAMNRPVVTDTLYSERYSLGDDVKTVKKVTAMSTHTVSAPPAYNVPDIVLNIVS